MTTERSTTRRRVLLTAGATLLMVTAAGCAVASWPDDAPSDVTPAPLPPTATRTATGTPTPTAPPLPAGVVRVALVDFAFEPGTDGPLEVSTGTTVRFVWVTSIHNILVDTQPAESTWEGHRLLEEAGFTHEHTFVVPGRYEFRCEAHDNLGMKGTLIVHA